MQFVSTVSSFPYIVIRHNVDFCKNEHRFMPLIIFHLNCILLLMMKMNKKQFLFHSWNIRAEGPLKCCLNLVFACYSVDIFIVKRANGQIIMTNKKHWCTKVMGRKNFQESINYCFHKQKVTVYSLHNMYVWVCLKPRENI